MGVILRAHSRKTHASRRSVTRATRNRTRRRARLGLARVPRVTRTHTNPRARAARRHRDRHLARYTTRKTPPHVTTYQYLHLRDVNRTHRRRLYSRLLNFKPPARESPRRASCVVVVVVVRRVYAHVRRVVRVRMRVDVCRRRRRVSCVVVVSRVLEHQSTRRCPSDPTFEIPPPRRRRPSSPATRVEIFFFVTSPIARVYSRARSRPFAVARESDWTFFF